MKLKELESFYRGKKILVTGHTGFKGSWLCAILSRLGAEVYGYSQKPPTKPSLFEVLYGEGAGEETREDLRIRLPEGERPLSGGLRISHIGDVRDFEDLKAFYSHGCEMMERRYKELLSYLEQ